MIEVDAQSEDEARELAHENINNFEVIDEWVSEWDINEVRELDEDGCAKCYYGSDNNPRSCNFNQQISRTK